MKRVTVECDWCGVTEDESVAAASSNTWRFGDSFGGEYVDHMCPACVTAVLNAAERVRAERVAARRVPA